MTVRQRESPCARCGLGFYAGEDGTFADVLVLGKALATVELCKHCASRPGIRHWVLDYAIANLEAPVRPEKWTCSKCGSEGHSEICPSCD